MLKRLKKAILRNLQQLARKQEMSKRLEKSHRREPSEASSEAGNAEKTQEDTPAASSKASPEAVNVEKTQVDNWVKQLEPSTRKTVPVVFQNQTPSVCFPVCQI